MDDSPHVPLPTAPAAPEAHAPETTRRFCPHCGAAWDAQWAHCPFCARRSKHLQTVGELTREKQSIAAAIWLYGLLLGVSIVSICVVLATRQDVGFGGLVAETICSALIVGGFFIGTWRAAASAFGTLGPRRWYGLAPLLAVGTFALATLALKALHLAAGVEELRFLPLFQNAGYGLGMATLLIAVAPAIMEETAFRGIIYGLLSRALSRWETILVSAGMFAILHLSIASLPHLFVLGLALAWLRGRTGSIYPGMLLHFTHNLCCLLAERAGDLHGY